MGISVSVVAWAMQDFMSEVRFSTAASRSAFERIGVHLKEEFSRRYLR